MFHMIYTFKSNRCDIYLRSFNGNREDENDWDEGHQTKSKVPKIVVRDKYF